MAAAWCFEDQSTSYTEAVLQAVIDGALVIVPTIWRLEVVNTLLVAERRKKILPEKTAKFVSDLERFSITVDVDGLEHIFNQVLHYGRDHQRSSYDASYLELARCLRVPLATKDEPLAKAAIELGISIFQP